MILFLGLQLVHFIADYCTQNMRILSAKKYGTPLMPILEHALHHAIGVFGFTYLIFLIQGGNFNFILYATILTLISHFLIDVMKGKMTKNFPNLDGFDKKGYWVYMGFDQFLHQVIIGIIINFRQF